MIRVLTALVACVAVALPVQEATAASHRHKAKHRQAKPCKRAVKRKGKSRAARKRRRCTRKGKAVRKHLAPKRTVPRPAPSPAAPLVTSPLAGGGPTAPLGRYLSISGKEFRLQLSRPALAAGSVTLEFRNIGEDPHDLVLSPDDGSHAPIAAFGETASGGIETQSLTLPAGRYYLFCSLPNHEALGMSAHLSVQ